MLLALVVIVFTLTRMSGSPAALLLPGDATAQDVAELETRLGLREPVPVQFVKYVMAAMTGDLGKSLRTKRPVVDMFMERLPATLQVLFIGMLVMSIGVPLGLVAALTRGSWIDLAVRLISSVGM